MSGAALAAGEVDAVLEAWSELLDADREVSELTKISQAEPIPLAILQSARLRRFRASAALRDLGVDI